MKKSTMKAGFLVLLAGLTLAGCTDIGTGSSVSPGPVGVGSSVRELKGTPCACTEIPMSIPESIYGA